MNFLEASARVLARASFFSWLPPASFKKLSVLERHVLAMSLSAAGSLAWAAASDSSSAVAVIVVSDDLPQPVMRTVGNRSRKKRRCRTVPSRFLTILNSQFFILHSSFSSHPRMQNEERRMRH